MYNFSGKDFSYNFIGIFVIKKNKKCARKFLCCTYLKCIILLQLLQGAVKKKGFMDYKTKYSLVKLIKL